MSLEGDQIRLLKLLPDLNRNKVTQCEVFTFSLSEAPEYQDISYEWGPASFPESISISGKYLSIRRNLWDFLELFRDHGRNTSFLWIDQITIDQSNRSERSHQVQLMDRIYRQAMRVIAWLGSDEDVHVDIQRAVDAHKDCCLATCNCSDSGCLATECKPVSECGACCYSEQYWGIGPRMATDPHLHVPDLRYWSRLWIVQEIALAADVIFLLGYHEYKKPILHSYFRALVHRVQPAHELMDHLASLTDPINPLNDLSFDQAFSLLSLEFLQCTDLHDLIYGLLGIVRPTERISIDYGLPLTDLFEAVLEKVILSATLAQSLYGPSAHGLYRALEHLAKKLRPSPKWVFWLDLRDFE